MRRWSRFSYHFELYFLVMVEITKNYANMMFSQYYDGPSLMVLTFRKYVPLIYVDSVTAILNASHFRRSNIKLLRYDFHDVLASLSRLCYTYNVMLISMLKADVGDFTMMTALGRLCSKSVTKMSNTSTL